MVCVCRDLWYPILDRLAFSVTVFPQLIFLGYTHFCPDIIQEYAYGYSEDSLEEQDFNPINHDSAVSVGKLGSSMKQMIWILHFIKTLPEWLIVRYAPDLHRVRRLQKVRDWDIIGLPNAQTRVGS